MHFDSVSTNRIPIVLKNITIIEKLVDSILTAKREDCNADTTADEQEIDRLVYHLYGITYDEVLIVDPETPITEKEYNKE